MQNLNFLLAGRSKNGLANIYEVRSMHTQVLLGQVSWYTAWERYVFFPDSGTVYDADCLREVAKFLTDQMSLRTVGQEGVLK